MNGDDYEVEIVGVEGVLATGSDQSGEPIAARVKPRELAEKLTEFAAHFVDGFGHIPTKSLAGMHVDEITVGLTVTMEGNIAIASASAAASLQLRLTRTR